jgi:hypothetical protein
MFRKTATFLLAFYFCTAANAQTKTAIDSLADYDALFSELESFLDSITAPRSFTTVNLGITNGLYQYQTSSTAMEERNLWVGTPSVGYYNKNGLGISGVASILKNQNNFSLYQAAATASYDYLRNRRFLTGVSFTRIFTKKDLPFYTSPLNNLVTGYFSYRKWWLKPALAAGYGWGSITSVEQRKEKIKLLKKGRPVTQTTTIETTEAIADLSLSASIKHDFYWLNILSKHDYFRISPQLALTGGTQKFGLAQTSTSYISQKQNGTAIFYNSETNFLSAHSNFQLLSLSGRLRTEFSKSIYYIQPQLLFDYFFPEQETKLETSFVINAGILF